MKVKEIPFIGRRRPADIKSIHNLSNLGWSGPITLPIPIRFNGIICTHCVVSSYGAIRFTQASNSAGKWSYWDTDKVLPEDISETEKGWMIIPWGELVKIMGCGVSICLYEQDGNIVFDYDIKSSYDSNRKYTFRVEFSASEANIVRCYYYHCVSGYSTFIGIAKEPDNVVSWPLKENVPYMKKALEFDTSADEAEEPEVTKPFPPHSPFVPDAPISPPFPPKNPMGPTKNWQTVYEAHNYRVQELR